MYKHGDIIYGVYIFALKYCIGWYTSFSQPRRPSGNLHTCKGGSREFDSYQSKICVLSSATESLRGNVSE